MRECDYLRKRAEQAVSLIQPNSIYFGHPINIYNTPKETELVKKIESGFPKSNIYNPNQKHNIENYQIWMEETGRGMDYFFDVILPEMSAGVFLTFEDGMWGAGIFGEAEFLRKKGRAIWEIDINGHIKLIGKLDSDKKLSVEKTRRRIHNG